MQIYDVAHSAILDKNLYFDDVSTKLWSAKTLLIIASTPPVVSITGSSDWQLYKHGPNNSMTLLANTHTVIESVAFGVNTAYVLRIAHKSDSPELQTAVLNINNDAHIITCHCQSIAEEVRYDVMLSNHKLHIEDQFLNAFKDTNLDEAHTDNILLNRKRKELLIDLYSVKSFVGTYKGLLNAIEYFGYDTDVFVKEFWLDIDNELRARELSTANTLGIKTNMLSLVYRLNTVTQDYDANDVPELINVFKNDTDALIKILNMRQILLSYFLPAHAMIIDVIGEQLYFDNYETSYYMHTAMTHNYSVCVDSALSVKQQLVHMYQQVTVKDALITGVNTTTRCVELISLTAQDDAPSDDANHPWYMSKDNYSTLWITLLEPTLFQRMSLFVRHLDAIIFELDDITQLDVYLGFLGQGDYIIDVQLLDNYNILHTRTIKHNTELPIADFELFMHTPANLITEPDNRYEFDFYEEGIEFMKWRQNVIDNMSSRSATLDALMQLQAYGSATYNINNVASHVQPTIGLTGYDTLAELNSLQSYRQLTTNAVLVEPFLLNVEEAHALGLSLNMHNAYNMSYAFVHNKHAIVNDVVNVSNASVHHMSVTVDDNDMTFSYTLNNVSVTENAANLHSDWSTLSEYADLRQLFDLLVYPIYNMSTDIIELVVRLVTIKSVQNGSITSASSVLEYRNLLSSIGSSMHIKHIIASVSSEVFTVNFNGNDYSTLASIATFDDIHDEIQSIAAAHEIPIVSEVHDDGVYIAAHGDLQVSHQAFGSVLSRAKLKHVNDLIKIRPGDNLPPLAIVFAQANDALSKLYDITWELTEHSDNDTNVIATSTNGLFSSALLRPSSYTLSMSYTMLRLDGERRTVTKQGCFLVNPARPLNISQPQFAWSQQSKFENPQTLNI